MIRLVRKAALEKVIDERLPLGLFLTRDAKLWVAVDNSTGDAWTEDFKSLLMAIRWLQGESCGDELKHR